MRADLCWDWLKRTWLMSEYRLTEARLSRDTERRYSSHPCSTTRGWALHGSKNSLVDVTSRMPETTPWEGGTGGRETGREGERREGERERREGGRWERRRWEGGRKEGGKGI